MGAKQRPQIVRQGWRYTLVGLFCAMANYGVMLAVDSAGGHYTLGIFIAFLCVTPLGYLLHSFFTFSQEFSLRAFMRFAVGIVSGYPLALLLMFLLCTVLKLSVLVAIPIATVSMYLFNFVMARWSILGSSRSSLQATSEAGIQE